LVAVAHHKTLKGISRIQIADLSKLIGYAHRGLNVIPGLLRGLKIGCFGEFVPRSEVHLESSAGYLMETLSNGFQVIVTYPEYEEVVGHRQENAIFRKILARDGIQPGGHGMSIHLGP
jgi:hypothetical protein